MQTPWSPWSPCRYRAVGGHRPMRAFGVDRRQWRRQVDQAGQVRQVCRAHECVQADAKLRRLRVPSVSMPAGARRQLRIA